MEIKTLCDRYIESYHEHYNIREELEDKLHDIFEINWDNYDGDEPWDDISVDPVDWDGQSLELTGCADHWNPTEEQIQKCFELGFTVIRIDFITPRSSSHGFSGDIARVKGFEAGKCDHSKKE